MATIYHSSSWHSSSWHNPSWHNPNRGTSRKVLGMSRVSGDTHQVIEFLNTAPTRAELKDLLPAMGMTPRQLPRRRGTPFDEHGCDDSAKADEQLIEAILAHPILMERPVVVTANGTRLRRPAEKVLEVLG